MKIISKFKDYYDYLLGKYGSDPKVIFDRRKLKIQGINHSLDFGWYRIQDEYDYRILCICGKYYILICNKKNKVAIKTSDFRLITEKDLKNKQIFQEVTNLLREYSWVKATEEVTRKKLASLLYGVENSKIIELSKKINCPIFVIISQNRQETWVNLDENIPNLSKIKGISAVYPPEQLFNDISFFIGNVLNNNLDDSHLILSDKDKILKGGFDLVSSFRGKVEK